MNIKDVVLYVGHLYSVQAILDQKDLTRLAGGVREGPNIAKYGPRFWLLSPLEAFLITNEGEKTTVQGPKVVFKASFTTNRGILGL